MMSSKLLSAVVLQIAMLPIRSLALLIGLVDAVPTVEIAPGVQMPMIAFGSYNGSYRGCTVEEGVLQWLKLGGRHVDAAHMYETEADVGAAVKASGVPREDERLTFVRTTQNFNIFSWSVELRWETQKGVVPITATCTKAHVLGDLDIFNFTLSAQDMEYLDRLMPTEMEEYA
eukprot:g2029.t1